MARLLHIEHSVRVVDPAPIWISLHVPKTAGTSFLAALREAFAPDELMADYAGDRDFRAAFAAGCPPLATYDRWLSQSVMRCAVTYRRDRRALTRQTTLVHGHFPARKYHPLLLRRRVRYIAWLREPFARAVSHYHYWRQVPTDGLGDPLVRQMLEQDWSLDTFLFHPALRNYQTRWLGPLAPPQFSFIGIVERYAQDLDRLSREVFRRPLREHVENESPERRRTTHDAGLRARFEAFHAEDYALYRHAEASGRVRSQATTPLSG